MLIPSLAGKLPLRSAHPVDADRARGLEAVRLFRRAYSNNAWRPPSEFWGVYVRRQPSRKGPLGCRRLQLRWSWWLEISRYSVRTDGQPVTGTVGPAAT